ncbi:DUF4330 domain-containing protein [Vampirovibrio sp.]|uniref:DUF4330 domain-containing protein n=1 Tax=Vampirovibrio sp. TaxID=2717857 RepID=UPI003593A9CA
MLIDQSGKLFGKINIVDFGGLALGLLVVVGVLVTQSGLYRTSGQVIKGEGDIHYTVYIRNLKTLQPQLFQPGKKLSITIRNQPRGQVEIVDVKQTPKRSTYMLPSGVLKTLADPADPYGYDYLITLKDHALFSEDGFVTTGIKVKVGLGIEVEGHDYRVSGAIVDVREASDKPAAITGSQSSSTQTP